MPEFLRITEETALSCAAASEFAAELLKDGPATFSLANALGEGDSVETVAHQLKVSVNTIYERIQTRLEPIAVKIYGKETIANRARTGGRKRSNLF